MIEFYPTPSVLAIAQRLEEAGYEAWCVGGAIRDTLLGGRPLDWDIATTALPQAVRDLFGRRRTIPVGIEFGTVSVLDDAGVAHEITTFRRDVTTDGRHATVEFGVSLEADLARRDLTMNAMAYRPLTNEMRDPFDGRYDIQRKRVRAVGDPEARMQEDRLRALRAIRFAGRYGFEIEPATLTAIEHSSPHLGQLSAERVQQELIKTMQQVDRPGRAMQLWRDVGALTTLIPSLASINQQALDTLDELPRAHGAVSEEERTVNRVAALFLDVGPQNTRVALTALRFSKHDIMWAHSLVRLWDELSEPIASALLANTPSDEQVRRWLAAIGRHHSHAFLRVASARWRVMQAAGTWAPTAAAVRALHRRMEDARLRDAIEVSDLAIGGDELRASGIPPGPMYARILNALLEQVLVEPTMNTPAKLLEQLPAIRESLSG